MDTNIGAGVCLSIPNPRQASCALSRHRRAPGQRTVRTWLCTPVHNYVSAHAARKSLRLLALRALVRRLLGIDADGRLASRCDASG